MKQKRQAPYYLPTANIPLLLETEKGTALLNEISANKKNETTGTEEVLDNIEKSKQASGAEKLFAPEDEYLLDQEYNATDEDIAEYEMRNAEMQQKIKEQQAVMNNEDQDLLFTTANEIINVTKNTERPYNYSEAMNMATIIDATLENISKNSGLFKAGAYKRFAPHFLSRFATQEELDTTIQNIKTERGSVAANRFNPYAITNYRKGKAYKNELADLNKTPIEQISGVHAMIKAVGMPIRITKAVTDFSEQYNEARRRMPRLFSNTHGVPYDEWRDIAIREGYTSDLDDWGYILELIANAPTRQEAIEEQKSELLRHEEKLQDLVESNIKNIENIDPEEAYRADEELALQEEAMFDEIDDRAMQNEILDSDEYEALYQQQEEARIAEEKLQGEIAEWENVITSLEKKPRNNILMLKQTPLAMKLVSADFKELHVAPHLFDGIFPNEKKNEKHNSHPNIDRDVLKKIPEALTDPIAVYRDNKNGDRFIFVTELTDKNGAYIIVPVDFEGKNRRANINLVLTSYAKDKNNKANFDWFIKNIKNIVYINRKKDKEFWQKNKRLLKNVSAKAKGVMSAGTNSLWDVSQSLKLNVKNESDLVKLKNQYPAFYQLAYHGTPHNFDKFTLDHIGSGEGAQAHGWGLYFAKDKKTSEGYKNKLASGKMDYIFSQDGKELSKEEQDFLKEVFHTEILSSLETKITFSNEFIANKLEIYQNKKIDFSKNIQYFEGLKEKVLQAKGKTITEFKKQLSKEDKDMFETMKVAAQAKKANKKVNAEEIAAVIDDTIQGFYEREIKYKEEIRTKINTLESLKNKNIQVEKKRNNGQLFEVDIPENDVLLDEDFPLEEQPLKVREAIFEYYKSRPDEYIVPQSVDDVKGKNGKAFYKEVVFQMQKEGAENSNKAASELLNSLGIQGITYDGRQDGRCFVVFDDKAISVLEKYYQEQKEISQVEERLQADLDAWENTVDKFEKGELNPRQSVIMLNNTPLVLTLLGANKNLTVSTDYSTLKKVLQEKHKLPDSVMKQIPQAMTDPIMIFKSATVGGDFVMMLELKDQHKATVVVPVSFNYNGIGGYTINYVPR